MLGMDVVISRSSSLSRLPLRGCLQKRLAWGKSVSPVLMTKTAPSSLFLCHFVLFCVAGTIVTHSLYYVWDQLWRFDHWRIAFLLLPRLFFLFSDHYLSGPGLRPFCTPHTPDPAHFTRCDYIFSYTVFPVWRERAHTTHSHLTPPPPRKDFTKMC